MNAEATKEKSSSAGRKRKEGPLTPPVLEVHYREYTPADHEGLLAMYANFEPKGAFQGLPPHKETLIRRWLDGLRESGSIFFVMAEGDRIIGHAMLCPSLKNTAELAIFVHQDFRGIGLGEHLLLGALNYACRRLALSKVWLSVQGSNVSALKLFQRNGFQPASTGDPLCWELMLQRPLNCQPCLGGRCAILGESFPFSVESCTNA